MFLLLRLLEKTRLSPLSAARGTGCRQMEAEVVGDTRPAKGVGVANAVMEFMLVWFGEGEVLLMVLVLVSVDVLVYARMWAG